MIQHIRHAIRNLNPEDVRQDAAQKVEIGLFAPTAQAMWAMERYLCPPELGADRRAEVSRLLFRNEPNSPSRSFDIEIWDSTLAAPAHAFVFDAARPERLIEAVLRRRVDLALPLARYIPPFRRPVIDHFIGKVAKENALFSAATALPDIVPILTLPWVAGEFASDTAFLTANQIRLMFLIAAANDRPVGYGQQRGQIASILAGAFGFRAIARELVGKIPFGAGLLPKAAIAYAGTYVVGRSLERYNATGEALPREDRKPAFDLALQKGREIAGSLLGVRSPRASQKL